MLGSKQSKTPPQSQRQQALYDPYESSTRGFSPKSEIKPVTYPPDIHDVEKGREGNRSWDLLAGTKKYQYEGVDFHASGELPSPNEDSPTEPTPDMLSQLYRYLLNLSVVTRWTLVVIPLLWIPGLLSLTVFPRAVIWSVRLVWWSVWLSVVWIGWWAALALARFLPQLARYTVGAVAVETMRYINWLPLLHVYIATFLWTLVICIAWQPLMVARQSNAASDSSKSAIDLIARILFGIFLSAAILVGEKFAIQIIAGHLHERSYAERIAAQQQAVHILADLYQHSKEDADPDPLPSADPISKTPQSSNKADILTTAALNNLAKEITKSPDLRPDSPQAKVLVALSSATETRILARRLFYSFARPGALALEPSDIANLFSTREEADDAYSFLDKDRNGDVTLEEVEMACMDCHHEQLSIAHSMEDTGSAVGRLDNIFMSLYTVIVAFILAVVINPQVLTLLTGLGTLVLGLSWLVGGSLAEILTSVIFLFVKHPYDVGDRVIIGGESYVVKEINLLSTVFLDKVRSLDEERCTSR